MYPVGTKYYLNLNGGRKHETAWQSSEWKTDWNSTMMRTVIASAATEDWDFGFYWKVTSMQGLNIKPISYILLDLGDKNSLLPFIVLSPTQMEQNV